MEYRKFSTFLQATLLLVLTAISFFAKAETSVNGSQLLTETLKLLEEGNQIIKLDGDHKDLMLLVGWSGSGKSTIAQIVSGSWETMEAYEINEDYLIRDSAGKISNGNTSFHSKTLFPELVIDKGTGEAIYDCPGFSDTRGTPIEIANGFFIKKLVEHARSIKILWVIKYDALKIGNSRDWFRKVVEQILLFIRNIPKYKGGIALVATKVDVAQTNEKVLRKIAAFLEQAQPAILESHPDRKEDIDALFSSLLEKDSNKLPINIQFFQQPNEAGLLSKIPDAIASRTRIRQMLFDNRRFKHQPCNASDFGIPLSDKAKAELQRIQITLNEQITADVSKISSALRMAIGKVESKGILPPEYFRIIVNAAERVNTEGPNSNEIENVLQVVADMATRVGVPDVKEATMRMQDVIRSLEYVSYLESRGGSRTAAQHVEQLRTTIKEVAYAAELNVRSKLPTAIDAAFSNYKDKIKNLMNPKTVGQQHAALEVVSGTVDNVTLNHLDFGKSVKELVVLNNELDFGLDSKSLETAAKLEKLLPIGGNWTEEQQTAVGFLKKLHENLENVAVQFGEKAGVNSMFPTFGFKCTNS